MPYIPKSHDLDLPDWGPYSKKYAGIAHIPDVKRGLRFDLAVIPGHYRRQMLIPNEKWASGHHAWEAASDLSYYTYRYEIEWQDRVYCDVSFSAVGDNARLVRSHFVNTTDLPQNLMLHLMAYMNFPPVRPYSDEPIRMMRVTLPENAIWIDALDYDDLKFATPRPTDNLVEDGKFRAEIRDHGLTDGSGIGDGFGGESGDCASYRFKLPVALTDAMLTIRYRLTGDNAARLAISGMVDVMVNLPCGDADTFGFTLAHVPIGDLSIGEHTLRFTSAASATVDLDGFVLIEADQTAQIAFTEHVWQHEPAIRQGAGPDGVLVNGTSGVEIYASTEKPPNNLNLCYPDVPNVTYGIAWDHPDVWVRQIHHDELDRFLRRTTPDNYTEIHHGPGEGHFTDVFMRPISLEPNSTITVYSLVCDGTLVQVERALTDFNTRTQAEHDAIYHAARQNAMTFDALPSGEDYRFSQERMAATVAMNVVYPVFTQRQFIRHYTPGKWWDCLYTWDSGFIGLGLLQLDVKRSKDNLNAYLTDPGNPHAAFIHHGSPVPVQIYQFQEIWNRTQDQDWLQSVYPALRQYYLFLAGHAEGSTTRELKSSLIRTWELFLWDSGGWDDYPAQIATLDQSIHARTTCAAITAHVILSARILLAAAEVLNLPDDVDLYRDDIATLTDALQTHAWAAAGVFSYVVHDENGEPAKHLRHDSGINFNLGLDGIMPLIAGVCTLAQQDQFMAWLQDPERYWTPIGLSTVDQSAPYYRKDGYWNGAVWMPQQWFIWKAALDLGHGDFAYLIAKTALDLWQQEVGASYYCFEHFIIETGRGAGWHQFGGLSSPVLAWFSAYHVPGRLTTGFNIWVESAQFSDDNRALDARLRHNGEPRPVVVIITLQPDANYEVMWNSVPVEYKLIHPGTLQIILPFGLALGSLTIR